MTATDTQALWDDFALPLGDRIADDLRAMAADHDAASDRSAQVELGPSEIGDPCTRCLAARILGLGEDSYGDPWARIIGTATHAWLDEAAVAWNIRNDNARWLPEYRVFPDDVLLPRGGSCDLYDEQTKTVIDHKIVGITSLRKYKSNGPGLRYRRQAQLYGLGYENKGHQVDHVAIAFWHRGGKLDDLWVHTEPYDQTMAEDTLTRYRSLRELVIPLGAPVLEQLPSDPDCFQCSRNATKA